MAQLSDRRMRRIFLLSLALHGILLTLLPGTLFQGRESTSAAKEMQATLVTGTTSAVKAAPERPSTPETKPVTSPRPQTVHREALRNAPALPPTAPVSEGSPRAETVVANVSANVATVAPSTMQPSRSEPSPDGLREYRLALGREARRFKQEFDRRYDAMERERQRGWEGRVEMTVHTKTGLAPTVVLARSSG
ncbi:MAG: hypothetical protein ACM3SV_10565, partial [Betaproteobacteria bacterium]